MYHAGKVKLTTSRQRPSSFSQTQYSTCGRTMNVYNCKTIIIIGTYLLRGPSVVIRLTCDCAVADDAVMSIRAESSS